MARPTLWNPELQAKICELVEQGDRPEVAAGVHGIGRTTYFEWMQRGGAGEEPYAGFRIQVARAIDRFESGCRKKILGGDESGGFGPAKAALEVLSRRIPKHWAAQVKVHVETVEEEFFSALEQACSDPNVLARVCEEKDCRVIFAAVCAILASRESESEATGDPGRGEGPSPVH